MSTATATTRFGSPTPRLKEMIALFDQLDEVVGAENRLLATGLPASLAQTVARKTELANQLDGWLELMRRGELGNDLAEPQDLALLIARLHGLRTLMGENALRIKRSMDATRRRIDGIMQALRADSRPAVYGAGSVLVRRTPETLPGRTV